MAGGKKGLRIELIKRHIVRLRNVHLSVFDRCADIEHGQAGLAGQEVLQFGGFDGFHGGIGNATIRLF